jgi:K(+)-stimulated pyrophosphate-energized sodium pump
MDTTTMTLAAFGDLPLLYFIAPAAALLALVMAFVFSRGVMKYSEGDDEMIRIAQAVRDGAMAYLKRQYRVVTMVFVALVGVLAVLSFGLGIQPTESLIGVPLAGLFSGLCGWLGMKMATNASARTTFAVKDSLNEGLRVAFRSGAVMGLVVVGFALLDASVWFFLFNAVLEFDIRILTTIMLSFGMGASTQALFARVGGGIYTKAADVGADLVGKVEAGIPEDDARNPATIADNVGDNVGDVAGMGADLYESYYGSILATMALGAAAAFTMGLNYTEAATLAMQLAVAPLALAGAGILCSVIGIFTVKAKEGATFAELLKGLHMGVYVASALIAITAFVLLFVLIRSDSVNSLGLAGSIISGLAAGLIIAHATEHYTSYEYEPTRRIARQAITGPATVIISGIAEGMKSTWASLLTVVVAIIAAFTFAGGGDNFLMGLYGVGIAAVGMLATLGITLATDAYGPIADNAGGNAEMTDQPPQVRERTDMLDSLGNTTAATGKGFAIGSAALTALALFAAYIQVVQIQVGTQASDWVQKIQAVTPTQVIPSETTEPLAVYQGYGKFAIVIPKDESFAQSDESMYYDGAMVDPDSLTRRELRQLKIGQQFSLRDLKPAPVVSDRGQAPHSFTLPYKLSTASLVGLSGDLEDAAGNSRPISFRVMPTKNASIGDVLEFYDVTLINPRVLGGIFIGVLLAFLFCALTMDAVGRAANGMMIECRRQFGKMREAYTKQGMSQEDIADPTKWPKQVEYEGVVYPDYASCVSISTASAQREMVMPALLALLVPILVGLLLGVPGVMGMLTGGLTSGFAMAIFMANAGGAWDNAKKLIESYGKITVDEFLDDRDKHEAVPHELRETFTLRAEELRKQGKGDTTIYGKGSEDHKATVVGDTVGDPFKDTSGPSLNILIKLISIVSVVFAGFVVMYGSKISSLLGL